MAKLIFLLTLFFNTHVLIASQSSCDCHEVNSWNGLRDLIMKKTDPSRTHQIDLPLCPFNIGKYHNSQTQHWSEIIYVGSPIHIYCKKETPSDQCSITVTGDACGTNQNCGRQLFKVMTDDIWLQGITINNAKDVVVNIDKNVQNAKLIDMRFVGNEVPDSDTYALSTGVISSELDSSVDVLDSTFEGNKATPIYSRGNIIVHNSIFQRNLGTKFFEKGGSIFSKGEAVVSKSSFLYNWGGSGGYSVFTTESNFFDAGGNCFRSKNDWGCQGIQTKDECYPFLGANTRCADV